MLQRKRSHVKRVPVALAVVAYALAASHAPFLALDALAPRVKTIDPAAEDFPCADAPCGCRTAEKCRTACCCAGGHGTQARAPRRGGGAVRVMTIAALAEARCSGSAPGAAAAGFPFDPHVPPPMGASRAVGPFAPLATPLRFLPPSPPRDPPDKVPL